MGISLAIQIRSFSFSCFSCLFVGNFSSDAVCFASDVRLCFGAICTWQQKVKLPTPNRIDRYKWRYLSYIYRPRNRRKNTMEFSWGLQYFTLLSLQKKHNSRMIFVGWKKLHLWWAGYLNHQQKSTKMGYYVTLTGAWNRDCKNPVADIAG